MARPQTKRPSQERLIMLEKKAAAWDLFIHQCKTNPELVKKAMGMVAEGRSTWEQFAWAFETEQFGRM